MCCEDPISGFGQLYKERIVKARINHRCGTCEDGIKPGEKYLYFLGIRGTEFSTGKMCLKCKAAFEELEAVIGPDDFSLLCICSMEEAVEDALDRKFLKPDHALVVRWAPCHGAA